MEFNSLTKQQKNGLRETVIRKTHRQGRVILQPCKFFKCYYYIISLYPALHRM
nr:MAG TPA: hypothetical protein [Caudoviricetes sp.]